MKFSFVPPKTLIKTLKNLKSRKSAKEPTESQSHDLVVYVSGGAARIAPVFTHGTDDDDDDDGGDGVIVDPAAHHYHM